MVDDIATIKEQKKISMPIGPKDHADGIYFGMSDEDYHGDSALGASGICDLTVSPLAFWINSGFNPKKADPDYDEKETAATIRGTYFHEALANKRPTVIIKPQGMSFATKEGKAFRDSHEGATFIKAEDTVKVQEMIDAMRETGALEKVGGIGGGISEVAFFWTDKIGRRRKMKCDRIWNGQLFDWKTMANKAGKDTETLVAHTVAQYRYHIKAFWYQTGIQAMKAMIKAKGHNAFMTGMAETHYQEMAALAEADTIVPFWYIFIENTGVPNIIARKFVSHDVSGQLNAYFRGAKQECERALDIFDQYMRSHGPTKPWHQEVYFKEFTDSDFSAARWILAED